MQTERKHKEKPEERTEKRTEKERTGQRSLEECVKFSNEKIDYEVDKDVVKELGCVIHTFLAHEMLLLIKLFGYKYNVTGPTWYQNHLLLEKIYDTISGVVDCFAIENRKFGLLIPATIEEYSILTHQEKIQGPGTKSPEPSEMFSDLTKSNEEIIKKLDKEIEKVSELKVKSTEDFLLDVMRTHKKVNWWLRAGLYEDAGVPK